MHDRGWRGGPCGLYTTQNTQARQSGRLLGVCWRTVVQRVGDVAKKAAAAEAVPSADALAWAARRRLVGWHVRPSGWGWTGRLDAAATGGTAAARVPSPLTDRSTVS